MVPYDCSPNHEPALLKGEKSHWAVIVGYAFNTGCEEESKIDNLASDYGNGGKFAGPPESLFPDWFICVQPKSRRVGCWSAPLLSQSNAQLVLADKLIGTLLLLERPVS